MFSLMQRRLRSDRYKILKYLHKANVFPPWAKIRHWFKVRRRVLKGI